MPIGALQNTNMLDTLREEIQKLKDTNPAYKEASEILDSVRNINFIKEITL